MERESKNETERTYFGPYGDEGGPLGMDDECWIVLWAMAATAAALPDRLGRGACCVWPLSWWNWLSRTRLTSAIHVSLTSLDGACSTHTSWRPVRSDGEH